MHTYYALTIGRPLSFLEIFILYTLLAMILIVVWDIVKVRVQKNQKSKMLEAYLYIIENQWNEIIEILTDPKDLSYQDIEKTFDVDITRFNSKYRNILYHELLKIKKYRNVNPKNWRLLINYIYSSNKRLRKLSA